MKLIYVLLKYTTLPILSAVFLFSCTSDTSIAGGTTETTSANVIGTIRHEDNNRAAGVTVKLIPAGFNPGIDSGIDSVVTNKQGNYSFKISRSGYFNIYAQSQNQYCYTDSIFCRENNQTVVNDTLRTFGSVEGRIGLSTSGRFNNILVLVIGTNTYAIPDSITGIFTIPFMAEGNYVFRILSPEKLYEYVDTMVTVSAGKKTILPEIVIPFAHIPELENIQSTFDSKTMYQSLSWPSQDTSEIAAYYLFRNSAITDTPLAVINCPDTTFKDDLLLLNPDSLPFGDSIRYCVVAIGKDRTFKKISSFQNILFKNTSVTVDTIILPEFIHTWNSFARYFVDKNNNCYLYGVDGIVKFSPTGQLMAKYKPVLTNWFTALSVDPNGYVYAYYDNGSLMRLTPDLKRVNDTIITGIPGEGNYSIIVKQDGFIDFLYSNGSDNTFILTFDSTLIFKNKKTVNLPSCSDVWTCSHTVTIYNNTFLFGQIYIDPITKDTLQAFYDIDNNIIKTINIENLPRPAFLTNYSYGISYVPYSEDNRFLTIYQEYTYGYCALLASNPDATVYGRAAIKGASFFDGVSKLYSLDTWNSKLYIYTIN